jgi:uncharacterized protein (TIGR00369 family)
MKPKNPNFKERLQKLFDGVPFVSDVGIKFEDCGPGWCETSIDILQKHLQQDQFIHAGVQATMADHTAGGAAGTLIGENEFILTVEFKINLLRPAVGDRLSCKAKVIRPGNKLIVVESEVFSNHLNSAKLVSKATVTLMVLNKEEKA